MVTAKNGRENYRVELDNGTRTVVADVASDKGGGGAGFRPHELLEAAYAACLNISVRMMLDCLHWSYDDVQVEVQLDRKTPGTTVFRHRIAIAGPLTDEQKAKVLSLAVGCPVRKTLSQTIEFRPLA